MEIGCEKHTFPIFGGLVEGAVAEWGIISSRKGRFGAM